MTDDCNSSAIASTVEPVIGEVEGKKKRRVDQRDRRSHRGAGSVIRTQVTDISMALHALEAAKDEIAQVQLATYLRPYERREAMKEPMSKLVLVRRFIDGVLKGNGYEP